MAAINMLYGAAAAGVRAMTASSGPGISLMQEGISYMAGAELPCVIADITRGGPGLGSINSEQGDYHQVVKGGGHGNYRTLVLAPYSVQEMADLTALAFELADRYRNPVFVLADGFVGQMMEPVEFAAASHRSAGAALGGNRKRRDAWESDYFAAHGRGRVGGASFSISKRNTSSPSSAKRARRSGSARMRRLCWWATALWGGF